MFVMLVTILKMFYDAYDTDGFILKVKGLTRLIRFFKVTNVTKLDVLAKRL